MSWRNPQNYTVAVLVAIVLHLAVIGLFFVPWPQAERDIIEPVAERQPKHLMAQVIQEENKAVKQRREQAEKKRKRDQARKRAAKKRAEQKRIAKKKAQQKRKADQKRAAEKKRQDKIKRDKLAKEKAARAKAAKEQAAKVAAQQKAAEEQALAEQLAQEEAQRELEQVQRDAERRRAQQQAQQRAATLTEEYRVLIHDHISSQWRFPSVVERDQEVVLTLTLVPTGEVVQVSVVRSSGNIALDRSVEQAVYRASPLPVPEDNRVFESNFRTFTLKFRPENASW